MAKRQWVWHFDAPPDRMWAALADTARFNEAAGFPKHVIEESADDDGFVTYTAHARLGPFNVEWEDIPVQWIAGRFFQHDRVFRTGPFARMDARLELTSENGGTHADYVLEVVPRDLLGRILVNPFLSGAGRTFERLVGGIRGYLAGDRAEPFVPPAVTPDRMTQARLDGLVAAVEESGNGHALANRLADYLVAGAEQDLEYLRPLRLARQWDAAPRSAIELCLQATHSGLLTMHWVLLCPRCRGAKSSAPSLDRLPASAHCASCNIDYGREFYRNVELTFRPPEWLRPIEHGEYCLYGPMSTPHVVVQQTLDAGEVRDITLDLPFGSYRLRTLHPGTQADVDWEEGGFPEVTADETGARAGEAPPPGMLRLRNAGGRRVTFVIEERDWVREALTAHRVTTLQTFRDLFGEETLRPGDEASVERIALMFTDLKGSTALYERIGDGAAYNLVRAHFAFLANAVRRHNGAIVKTIGDAVMAAFADPADALEAALAIQDGVAGFNQEQGAQDAVAVTIKLGLHQGPAVVVRLNDRLDYFGGTVNMAARLQGTSDGGDVVLSTAFAQDPAVAAILETHAPVEETTDLKGITGPVTFLRLRP